MCRFYLTEVFFEMEPIMLFAYLIHSENEKSVYAELKKNCEESFRILLVPICPDRWYHVILLIEGKVKID